MNSKTISVATPEKKAQLLQAMISCNKHTRSFASNFANSDFVKLPHVEEKSIAIWAAQRDDVTVLIWERGTDTRDWAAKIQCW